MLAHFARKRALACLFPELVRQSAQATALLKLWFRDVLNSLRGGCGLWLPSSLNFSVASHYVRREGVNLRASKRWNGQKPTATLAIYATIIVNWPCYLLWPRNASTPTEPARRRLVDFRPSVRNGRLYGRRPHVSSDGTS